MPGFQQVLVYGRPSALAWLGWILVALILGGYGARFALYLLGLVAAAPSTRLQWGVGLAGFACLFALGIPCARPALKLGAGQVAIPHLLGYRRLAYDDIASYALVAATMSLGRAGKLKGQVLTIRSRRPGVAPLEVFVPDKRPLDPALLARLDRVIAEHDEGVSLARRPTWTDSPRTRR